MTYQANQTAAVMLRDEHDYRAWYSQLQARCISHNIWDQVNPAAATPRQAIPTEPTLPDFATYAPSTTLPAGAVPQQPSDLSSVGLRAYKEDLEFYKLQMERYKLAYTRYKVEETSLQQITAFIQSTVVAHLQQSCCLPDQTIRDWITNLKAQVGITDEAEREQARQRYHSALKPPRSVNSWDIWLAEYNQAATEAETLTVPDTTQFRSVAVDFMSSVNKIAPMWAATFQSNGIDQTGITRQIMMRRFREYMMLNHPITRGRSQKAAFAVEDPSVFLAANSNADQRVVGDAHHVETGNSHAKKRGRPRYQRTAEDDAIASPSSSQSRGYLRSTEVRSPYSGSTGATPSNPRSTEVRSPYSGSTGTRKIQYCPACGAAHSLQQCYYLHPENAPEWWQPRQALQRAIEIRSEHDLDFQGLLRSQSRLRTRAKIIKQSQTPQPEIEDQ